jgi:hypothetical protein
MVEQDLAPVARRPVAVGLPFKAAQKPPEIGAHWRATGAHAHIQTLNGRVRAL